MSNEPTTAFCAREQADTLHTLTINNADIILTCECGHFIKFPVTLTTEEFVEAIAKHREANMGQLKVEQMQAKENELIQALNSNTTPPSEPGTPTPDGPEAPFEG